MSKKRNSSRGRKEEEVVNLTERERLLLQSLITDFIASDQPEVDLPGLSAPHRKYLHTYAAKLGLKTRSSGKKNDRVLKITIRRRVEATGDIRRLKISMTTRNALAEIENRIRVMNPAYLQRHFTMWQNQPHKKDRVRGDALMVGLGARMVPPLPKFVDPKLMRDRKELPIYAYGRDLHEMLRKYSVFIINGETGSGKTTQVPQYILEQANRENKPCRVVVTQPRRMAAVTVAQRVADERGEPLGDTVGYQIRMESRVCKTTNLIYTTSGCLLRTIMSDVTEIFRKVTHLIIDEIHERDKYTDFTLITLKEHLRLNKDLRVILMSATMDINQLSKYFDDCPVLNVPGQGYDVKIYHLEDILYHTGYRTALMEAYLRADEEGRKQKLEQEKQLQGALHPPPPPPPPLDPLEPQMKLLQHKRLADEYLQTMLDRILEQCCILGKSEEELCELFDQLRYYIESEGMPIDAAHSDTGITPLMAACKANCYKYVHIFKQYNANPALRDAIGYSAVDYARYHPDGYCLQILDNNVVIQQQQTQEEIEKGRLLTAYQQQFNDNNDVDHDLIASLLEGLYRSTHPGAIMVFLPGYSDILQQREIISSMLPAGKYVICILHGQMDSQDQSEALKRHSVRKIILSTNIGQTSITIPDLAYIIDSGKVKMKTYDSVTESSQLQTTWISKADASQRSGRAGRTQNGICYRLYSRTKYDYMSQFCVPEFMRIPLTEICLYAKTLDKQLDVQSYLSRALNPPSFVSIMNAVRKLQVMKVFNDDESVTELGKHLVEIPLDVQLGKCLLYSIYLKCFDSVLTICAFHSVKDPFVLPTDRNLQGQASFQRKSFAGQTYSDQVGILTLYKAYTSLRNNKKRVREFCNKYFLSQSGMELFCATRKQIADVVSQKYRLGQHATAFNDDWNIVRFCLVAGFYPNIVVVDRNRGILLSGTDKQLVPQRTSALNPPGMKTMKDVIDQIPHEWIIYFEKSRMNRDSAINMNTPIPPLIVALQCGREFSIAAHPQNVLSSSDDEDTDDEYSHSMAMAMNGLSLSQYSYALLSIDNWIKFQLCSVDAKNLKALRNMVETQFFAFLRHGHTMETSAASYFLQKVLYSADSGPSPVKA